QLSLAIGKEGQNVRLAARLTGWKIDIKDSAKYDYAAESAKIEAQKQATAWDEEEDEEEIDVLPEVDDELEHSEEEAMI
ncbi:MAG TPA: transcription termination/antitermination protein NusA, partial [Candidatus Sericytochromatia bacterium]